MIWPSPSWLVFFVVCSLHDARDDSYEIDPSKQGSMALGLLTITRGRNMQIPLRHSFNSPFWLKNESQTHFIALG